MLQVKILDIRVKTHEVRRLERDLLIQVERIQLGGSLIGECPAGFDRKIDKFTFTIINLCRITDLEALSIFIPALVKEIWYIDASYDSGLGLLKIFRDEESGDQLLLDVCHCLFLRDLKRNDIIRTLLLGNTAEHYCRGTAVDTFRGGFGSGYDNFTTALAAGVDVAVIRLAA